MASWSEIDRLRKNAEAFRALAKQLAELAAEGLTEWELAFCQSIMLKTEVDEFSTRQGEKLLQIRDGIQSIDTFRGFSIKALLAGCFQARNDLSEDDEQWIVSICTISSHSIKRTQAGRLMRCATELGLIDEAVAS